MWGGIVNCAGEGPKMLVYFFEIRVPVEATKSVARRFYSLPTSSNEPDKALSFLQLE